MTTPRYYDRIPNPDDADPVTCECGDMMRWDAALGIYVCLAPAEDCSAKPLPGDQEVHDAPGD